MDRTRTAARNGRPSHRVLQENSADMQEQRRTAAGSDKVRYTSRRADTEVRCCEKCRSAETDTSLVRGWFMLNKR